MKTLLDAETKMKNDVVGVRSHFLYRVLEMRIIRMSLKKLRKNELEFTPRLGTQQSTLSNKRG